METLSTRIQTAFSDYAILKDKSAYRLFAGRNLPAFVKDYILNRFTINGERDDAGIREYLAAKMPQNSDSLMMRLLDGELVNITTRVNIKTRLDDGMVAFMLPDLNISANMFILPKVLSDNKNELVDGENWGNITLQYMPPEGRKKGYVLMTSFKSFNPYKNLDFEDFISRRADFSTEEWIDVLLITMGYEPDSFSSMESKFTMITRLLPAIEPNLNFIELGPKSSGKSFIYNNLSQYFRMISGKCTRAQLIYNHSTKQYGAIKNHDLIVFDEVSTLSFDDRTGELQGFLKSFLEAGNASLANIKIISSCGLGLAGNIALTENLQPVNEDFMHILPDIFMSSAMLDRFHLFIPGWKLPKISAGSLYYGWSIDAEVFSEFLHYMRSETYSQDFFDELVKYDKKTAYVRHVKAVRKIASAYCKLLFPHVVSLEDMTEEDLNAFKVLYNEYCLLPALEARSYIYRQCKLIDGEFKQYGMPEFTIELAPEPEDDFAPEEEILPGDNLEEEGIVLEPVDDDRVAKRDEFVSILMACLEEKNRPDDELKAAIAAEGFDYDELMVEAAKSAEYRYIYYALKRALYEVPIMDADELKSKFQKMIQLTTMDDLDAMIEDIKEEARVEYQVWLKAAVEDMDSLDNRKLFCCGKILGLSDEEICDDIRKLINEK